MIFISQWVPIFTFFGAADTPCSVADMPHGLVNTLHGAANTATFTAFASFLANFEKSVFSFSGEKTIFSKSAQKMVKKIENIFITF